MCKQTFIFSYVLERKCEAGVLALDNAHFAKGTFADDAQQPEVVEVHCVVVRVAPSVLRTAWQVQSQCSRGHDAGLQHDTRRPRGLRTLVGEHHGLAVTLTHGGLQLGAVRAS